MYSVTVAQQTWDFVYSLGVGFLLGIVYDIINIKQKVKRNKQVIVVIFDIIYILISSVVTYFFILSSMEGRMRAFLLFGELLGWIIYYFSFGIVFRRIRSKFTMLSSALSDKIQPFIVKMKKTFKKVEKKIVFFLKKLKINLKHNKVMEYNLND